MPDYEILNAEYFAEENDKGIPIAKALVTFRNTNGLLDVVTILGTDWTPANKQAAIRKELELRKTL